MSQKYKIYSNVRHIINIKNAKMVQKAKEAPLK